jgi:hypothetical protein
MESGLPAGSADVTQVCVAVPVVESYVKASDPLPQLIAVLPTENATDPVMGTKSANATGFVTFVETVAVNVTA